MNTTVITENGMWDKLLSEIREHDVYHTYSYHKLAQQNGEGDPAMLVYRNKKVIIALPILIRKIPCDTTYNDITSVYGYAGPISNMSEISVEDQQHFKSILENFCDDQNIVTAFGRLHPLLKFQKQLLPSNIPAHSGTTIAIDLSLSEEEQIAQYKNSLRYDIGRLKREGYSTRWSSSATDISAFIQLYNTNMQRVKAANRYYFDTSYYDSIFSASDFLSRLMLAEHNNHIVAGSIFMTCGHIVQYHLSATDETHLKFSPVKSILNDARKEFSATGKQFLHLGGGIGGSNDTLFKFKAAFSNKSYEFSTWKYVHNTSKYESLCANLGLESSNTEMFPIYKKSI